MKCRLALSFFLAAIGCTQSARSTGNTGGNTGGTTGAGDMSLKPPGDFGNSPFDPSAACVTAHESAQADFRPVDIIWLIDNSSSMKPAIDAVTQGINAFANLIAGKSLDYKIIMLSLRSETNPVTVSGSNRYAVCVPQPLAGDAHCGNGARFFHSSVDIKSTQPFEELLGTLGQTSGYMLGEERGGEPWKAELRSDATKTIVVVSDDDSRMTPTQFETFKGGANPYNANVQLPPGILDPSWGGLFDNYIFDGIYGWGSTTDPKKTCTYSDNSVPPAPGEHYTQLVQKTNGVRAEICDDAAAWTSFLDSVAQAVGTAAKLNCQLDIPPPPSGGVLDPSAINVQINDDQGSTFLYKVANGGACGAGGGWYYDNDTAPTQVLLCPASCDYAQGRLVSEHAKIDVYFGCTTIVG
jgi:hypothetical protein